MRIVAEVKQDLPVWAERNVDLWAGAVTQGVAETAKAVQANWRAQIVSAGLGKRLSGTIRQEVYPKGQPSPNAAALIWSKAPEIIGANERGALIKSSKGLFLAVPLPGAGTGVSAGGRGGKRVTPAGWERRTGIKLRFVFRANKPSFLVADDARVSAKSGIAKRRGGKRRKDGILSGAQTVPIFILVPQVRLKKRLDLQGAARDGALALPGRIRAAAVARGAK